MIKKLLFLFFIGVQFLSFSQTQNEINLPINGYQERCIYERKNLQLMEKDAAFRAFREADENFILNYTQNNANTRGVQVVYTIPVVVHVIHRGEAISTGTTKTPNISDAQIQSAIDNLNAAYSNTSTANTTYTGVNTNMQFCLAKRDPSGNPTTGIVRVNGSSVTGYSTYGITDGSCCSGSDNELAVKALSKWDNTKYYNVWVVEEINDNGGGSGTQGYAYFPGAGSTVDGAVMLYNAFGYDPTGSLKYNLKSYTNMNVTPVHEFGHAFNLYHTFEGDGTGATCPTNTTCSTQGDRVCDTDPHKRSNSDCPTGTNTCTGNPNSNIVHNFMDYSSDACQTEFKAGQVTRMNATLTSGGSRYSLTQSSGCNPVYALDASILAILAPTGSYCQTTFNPLVTLQNFGSTTLTSVNILYNVDGAANTTYNWTGSLASGATVNVTLSPALTTTTGSHTFNAKTALPNGGTDQYTTNDAKASSFTISSGSSIPLVQGFEAGVVPPTNWSVTQNPSDAYTWDVYTGTQYNGTSTACAWINGYNYNTSGGEQDNLVSQAISLIGATNPQMTFKVAYKYYPNTVNYDTLNVLVSSDCGVTYTNAGYKKYGPNLATAGSSSSYYAPGATTDWRMESLDLSAYIGKSIVVAFQFVNKYGNNLYLDDINIQDGCTPPTVTVSSSTICAGQSTSVTAGGATTYSWSNGATTTSISVTPTITTTYTVTGTTAGCTKSVASVVTVNAIPTVAINSATICTGQSATLTASGATTYVWSNAATTTTISVTPTVATTYTVTGTTSGCSKSATGKVTVNSIPTVTVNSATVCSGNGAVLTANGATTYVWSTGGTANTLSVSPTSTTTYTVTGTIGSCSGSATGVITVNPKPTVTVNSATVCVGQSTTLTASGANSYSWSNGGTTASITVTPTSTTTYTITGTSTNGCIATATTIVTVNPLPFTSVNSFTICSGNSAVLTASGATTYVWSTSATTTTITITATSTTTYTVTGTASGCTSSVSSKVTVNTLPTLTVSSATICAGSSTTLTASGGATYVWSTGATTATITVTPTATSTYTVTGTSTNGCSKTASTIVTVNSTPVTTVNSATICAGQSASLTASGATTYVWSTGGTASIISVTPTATTTYTVTGSNGGCSSSATSKITVNLIPTVIVNSATICSGTSVCLTASGATTYSWNTGSTANSTCVTPASNTTYTVTGTTGGCSKSAIATVSVNALPTVTVNFATICNGTSTCLTASGATTYSWNTGSTANPICVTPTLTTTYSVTGTKSGCTASTTVKITVNPIPTITVNSATICAGQPASLTANGGTTYAWSTTATTAIINVTPTATSTYTVTGTTGGCSKSASAVVTVNSNVTPTISIVSSSGNTSCTGASVTYTATATNGGLSPIYQWQQNGNPVGTNSSTFSTTTLTTGDVITCVLTSNATCATTTTATSNSITMTITATVAPSVSIASSTGSSSSCSGSTVTFTPTPINGGTTPSYVWKLNGSNVGTGSTYSSNTLSTGNTVYCVMTSNSSCASPTTASSSTITMTVNSLPSASANASNSVLNCITTSATITAGGGGTYVWSTTETTSSISITSAGTYSVVVTDANSCTATASATVTQNTTSPSVSINPNTANINCVTTSTTLTASGGASYLWSTSEITASITVSAGGTYTVTGVGTNGCTATASSVVTQSGSTPATPTISQNGLVLTSSSATGNQWYKDGVLIPGATGQSYTATQNGAYTVVVTQSGCSSAASNPGTSITNVGIEEISSSNMISIYPNPNDGNFTLSFTSTAKMTYKVEIVNALGQLIFKDEVKEFTGTYSKALSIVEYGRGIYTISLTNSQHQTVKKIIVY